MRDRNRSAPAVVILTMCVICLQPCIAQVRKQPASHKAPDLALRLVPAKSTIGLHEGLSMSCELTNLTDKTLCFPPPANGCYFSIGGSRLNPDGSGTGFGIGCGCSECRATPENLLPDVEKRWIKLAPNQTHVAQCSSGVPLASTGTWNVTITYHPDQFSVTEKALLKSTGCTSPEADATSKIEVEVVADPPDSN